MRKIVKYISLFLESFYTLMFWILETRMVYGEKIARIKSVDALAIRDRKSHIDIAKDALDTAYMVRQFGIDTDDELKQIIIKGLEKRGQNEN